jgi:RNA polymerase sigma-70 factor (ECF subfamily)
MTEAEFESALRTHQAMVYSIAYHFFGGSGVAEEVAQDVFLELFQAKRPPGSTDHLTAWLRRVTVHRCIDATRRPGQRHEVLVDQMPEVADPALPSDPLLRDALRTLVASLPETPRAVIILRYSEDMDVNDISHTLQLPVRTVWSHLQRGLSLLREKAARRLNEKDYAPVR